MSLVLALTPNPAIDLTYSVPRLTPGSAHHLLPVARRAGGKGLNVARVAAILGSRATALAPVDAANLEFFEADCGVVGAGFLASERSTPVRLSFAVMPGEASEWDGGDATVFNETGPALTPGEWEALTASAVNFLTEEGKAGERPVLTVSGSMPPDTEPETLSSLISRASACAPVLVDTHGPALLASVRAGASLVKCNIHELTAATGTDSLMGGLAALFDAGATRALITLGPDGMVLASPTSTLRAWLPERVEGNPTGAGDAAMAAIAASWFDDDEAALRRSVAVSAASILKPTAGDVDPADADRLAASVQFGQSIA